jgi:myo-inositol 2-dehydrogenase / D-chiro-inositol 1-dehydrogenase
MKKINIIEKNYLTRRNFVKGSALMAGGLMVGGLPVGASANVAGQSELKVAVIGCGGRGTGAAVQALNTGKDVRLVAMAEAFEDRVESSYTRIVNEIQKQKESNPNANIGTVDVPKERRFFGFDAYKKVIPLADVIILTAPPGFRPMHYEECIKLGKHVFMEKPVAVDVPGVRSILEMNKLSRQKKLNVVVGLQRHYQTKYRETVKRLHGGAIGQVISGQVYWNNPGVWVRPRVEGQTEMEYQMRNWYYFNWLCGDHILEQHIHNIDVANWVIGEYPKTAQGMGGRQVRTGKDHGEIFDHHFVEFEYPGGAIIASQCRHQPGCMDRVSESFQGTKGRTNTNDGIINDLKGGVIYAHRERNDPNPYQVELDELFDAIRKGAFINDSDNGAYSTMAAIMGRMATYSGQVINWDEAMTSNINLMPERYAWDALPPVLPNGDGYYPYAIPGVTKVI